MYTIYANYTIYNTTRKNDETYARNIKVGKVVKGENDNIFIPADDPKIPDNYALYDVEIYVVNEKEMKVNYMLSKKEKRRIKKEIAFSKEHRHIVNITTGDFYL